MPDVPPPVERVTITREALLDGSLLARARARMPPGMAMLSDAEIEADLDATLTRHPPGEDVWLFGYGSLMWNPAIEFAERRGGVVHGWHRRFCLWLHGGPRLAGQSRTDAGAGARRPLRRHAVPHPCAECAAPSCCSPGGASCSPTPISPAGSPR